MTVEKLIEHLSNLPKDLEVTFPDYKEEKHYPIIEVIVVTSEVEPRFKLPYVSIGQGYFL